MEVTIQKNRSALEEECPNNDNAEPAAPFHCSNCRKKFTAASNLKRHERVHTGKKPFSCSVCSKAFRESGKLKTHERIHTDEKPFSCSKCERKFRQACHLKKHEQIHIAHQLLKE